MAVAIRGTTPATDTQTTTATLSVSLTGTRQPQTDDVLIIIHCNDWFTTSEMPTPTVGGSASGVTAITNGTADQGSFAAHAKSYYKVITSSGDVTVAVTETGTADEEKALAVYVLSGADTATPIDVAGNATAAATTSPAAPSISPTSTDAFLICHTNSGGGSPSAPYTPPSGMTEDYDLNVASAMGASGAHLQLSASGATGAKTFTSGNAEYGALSIAVKTAAAGGGGSVPYVPPRYPQYRDTGEAQWLQSDRRNANLVATAANPLSSPLDVSWQDGGRYWHLYNDLPLRTSQAYFGQEDRRNANLVASAANPLVSPLDSAWQADGRYWHLYGDWADGPRSWPPQQRAYISDPSLLAAAPTDPLTLAAGVGGDLWRRYNLSDYADRREVPQQRQLESEPGLLSTALLEDVLLGGATTALRALVPATHADRREVPQQRRYFADIDVVSIVGTGALGAWWGVDDTAHLLYGNLRRNNDLGNLTPASPHDPVLSAWLPLWQAYNQAAIHVDRREVPQQRAYISDPSTYPTVPPTDPLTVAWGAGGHYWLIYQTAALLVDRREVPQQRQYESEPGLLTTALLEGALLGGADDLRRRVLTAAYYDRRQTGGYQPRWPELVASVPADPLLVAAGVGGDRWRRYATPSTHVNRRLVPQQRPYARDVTLDVIVLVHNATSTVAVLAGRTSTAAAAAGRTSTAGAAGRVTSTPAVSDG